MNVSQVRQLSPFRYPGGKTWFVADARRWLQQQPNPSVFIEPFCGGGIVGLTIAAEGLAQRVVLGELDADVAAVWKCCLSSDAERLAQRILEFDLTSATVKEVLGSQPANTLDRAFRTIVFNRVSRGGVTANGAGILKRGENNKGLRSRWYPETLANRIRFISTLTSVIEFNQGDAFATIERFCAHPEAAFFIDPPYTAGGGKRAGSRLYQHSSLDHAKLFQAMAGVAGRFVMTYDNDADVIALAEAHKFHWSPVLMRNTSHREVQEIAITDRPWPVSRLQPAIQVEPPFSEAA